MALIFLWLSWLTLTAVLTGYGRCLCSLLKLPATGWLNQIWFGIILVSGILHICRLVAPVDWRLSALITLAGLLLLVRTRDRSRDCRLSFQRGCAPALAVLTLFHTYAGWMALKPPETYDSGLYYFQAIQWINTYPVVPGLANLNIQLGFNNLHFLWSALLNGFPLHLHGYLIWNSFVFIVAVTPSYRSLLIWLKTGSPPNMLGIFRIACLPAYMLFLHNVNYATASADFHTWILSLVIFDRTVVVLDALNRKRPLPIDSICLILFLAPLMVTVKLSMLVFGASLPAVLLTYLAIKKTSRLEARLWPRCFSCAFWAGGGLVAPWIIANVVMTGYPLYPAGLAVVRADWRVPELKTEAIQEFISEFPRRQGSTTSGKRKQLEREFNSILTAQPESQELKDLLNVWNRSRISYWTSTWWHSALSRDDFRSLIRLNTVMILVLAIALLRRRMSANETLCILLFLAPLVAALIFWWMKAPTIRFSLGFLSLIPIWVYTCVLFFSRMDNTRKGWITGCLSLGLCALFLLHAERPTDLHALPEIPRTEWVGVPTRHGLEIRISKTGYRVHNTPLPAASQVNPYLRLRYPEKGLAGGFSQLNDAASTGDL